MHGHPGGAGIEDKWRHTYPYVPTSYYYNNPAPPRQNPESIGGSLGHLFTFAAITVMCDSHSVMCHVSPNCSRGLIHQLMSTEPRDPGRDGAMVTNYHRQQRHSLLLSSETGRSKNNFVTERKNIWNQKLIARLISDPPHVSPSVEKTTRDENIKPNILLGLTSGLVFQMLNYKSC